MIRIIRKLCVIGWLLSIAAAYIAGYMTFKEYSKGIMDECDTMMDTFSEVTKQNRYEAMYYQKIIKGNLSSVEQKKMAKKLIEQMEGEVVKEFEFTTSHENKKLSVYGYSDMIPKYITTLGEKVNMNVVFTYNEEKNTTNVYLASPIMNYDF